MSERPEHRFRELLDQRLAWLRDYALPLWGRDGVDAQGGFFERIDQHGRAIVDLPKRARVVARQTYVFATATMRGWGDFSAQVRQGAEAVFEHCILPNGLALSTYRPEGTPLDVAFDGYDQAFVLFALAKLAWFDPSRYAAAAAAGERLLAAMQPFRHPRIGFEEAQPPRLPLLQNPHMHLLEACLAFDEVVGASSPWRRLAAELVSLAVSCLAANTSGAVHEYYDGDWHPIVDEQGGWIEPGHQFEWAWLLWQWAERTGDADAGDLADKLFGIGTEYGVSPTGQLYNVVTVDGRPRAAAFRLWPQTERLRACVAAAGRVTGPAREAALLGAVDALESLRPYLSTPIPGLWYDRLDDHGVPVAEAAPASSLYHLVGALDYAERLAGQATGVTN